MKSKHLIAAFVLAIGVGAGSAWAQESTYSVSGLPASESMVSQDQAESMRLLLCDPASRSWWLQELQT